MERAYEEALEPRDVFFRRSLTLFLFCFFVALGVARAKAPTLSVPLLAKQPSMLGKIDASWQGAAQLHLAFDFANRRPQANPPIVYVAQDADGLDIAFDVRQRSAVRAVSRSNGPGVMNDDAVGVSINPQGVDGYGYSFFANARGSRSQTSSENSAFAPTWTAKGSLIAGGYVVTMHIPFSDLRTGGSQTWRVQFMRIAIASGAADVWTYDPNQAGPTDPLYAGILTRIAPASPGAAKAKTRPRPRFQPYFLGVAASQNSGGSTSQMGLDFAVPFAPTASLLGSFHPDYSNVETDQQSISPTAFPRQFSEVRPFFTQFSSNFDNAFGCSNCPQPLYTFSIPTYRQAYGIEGTQGPVTFATFNAVGRDRTDAAIAANYFAGDAKVKVGVNLQRVAVNTPALSDSTTTVNGGVQLGKSHLLAYGNYGREDGTLITDQSQSHYGEVGVGYITQDTSILVARQFVGAQYSPVDGYVAQPDIAGYTSYMQKTFAFPQHSKFKSAQIDFLTARFWNHFAQLDQASTNYQVALDFKSLFSVHVFQQTQSVLSATNEFLPFAVGNGALLGYNLSSNTPAGIVYSQGAYYHGEAISWNAFDTIPLRSRVTLSLNANENIYASLHPSEPSFRQWLNTASVNWQFSRAASLALGVRRINGVNLPNAFSIPTFTPIFADNVSAAFHYLYHHNEFYLVYGNPNSLSTTPALYFKWIIYEGAEKGS